MSRCLSLCNREMASPLSPTIVIVASALLPELLVSRANGPFPFGAETALRALP